MKSEVTISVIAPQEPFDFFGAVWEGIWSAAYDLAPLGVNVETVAVPQGGRVHPEELLNQLLDANTDAILVAPSASPGLNRAIAAHTRKGRPVITFLADAPGSQRTAYVGPDHSQAGRLAGEMLGKMVRPGSHIVALTGSDRAPHVLERYDALRQSLMASGIPLGLSMFEDAESFAFAVGKKRKGFDALYIGSPETVDLGGILSQLDPKTPCLTFHLTDNVQHYLANGGISAVIDPSRYYQSYIAVQKAYECLASKQASGEHIQIPCSVIFRSHLSGGSVEKGLFAIFETLVHQRTQHLRQYRDALEKANTRLLLLAETDPLTNLLNRRKWEDILEKEIARAEHIGPVCLMMIDLDDFKTLNDVLGHPVGDQALKVFADILRSGCRAQDSVARIGGDEFSLILPDTSMEAARSLRERLRSEIRAARLPVYQDVRLSASIGIAELTPGSLDAAEFIQDADRALYEDKRQRLPDHRDKERPRATIP